MRGLRRFSRADRELISAPKQQRREHNRRAHAFALSQPSNVAQTLMTISTARPTTLAISFDADKRCPVFPLGSPGRPHIRVRRQSVALELLPQRQLVDLPVPGMASITSRRRKAPAHHLVLHEIDEGFPVEIPSWPPDDYEQRPLCILGFSKNQKVPDGNGRIGVLPN